MIVEKNLFEIGRLLKPHGIDGEITLLFNKPEFADLDINYYFFAIDGMFVPFFVESFTFNTAVTARIKFKGVDSIEEATKYSDTVVLVPDTYLKSELQVEEFYETEWHKLIGYTALDENSFEIGTIKNVDSSTLNVLFNIDKGEEEILIPATHDFIIKIESEQKKLHLKLPEGLLGGEET